MIYELEQTQYPVYYYFTMSKKDIIKNTGVEIAENQGGVCVLKDSNLYIGVFKNDLGLLVHELMHACVYTSAFIYEDSIHSRNDEHYAYLIQSLYNQCYIFMEKEIKEKFNKNIKGKKK